METNGLKVVFIGGGKTASLLHYQFSFDTTHLEKLEDLFELLEAENRALDNYVVFSFFSTPEETGRFVKEIDNNLPALFNFTPVAACLSSGCSGKPDLLKNFDYLCFDRLSPENVEVLVPLLVHKKRESSGLKKQFYLDQALLLDLLEKQKNAGMDTHKMGGLYGMYYSVDSNGIIQNVSDEVMELLGFSREEIIGRHYSDLVYHQKLEEVRNAFTERRTGERKVEGITVRFKTKNGGYKELQVSARGVHIPPVKTHPGRDRTRVYVGTLGKAEQMADFVNRIDVFRTSREPIIIYDVQNKR
ncbi:MAG: PAS domain S-box protein, partial [Spirochaetota bacterium]